MVHSGLLGWANSVRLTMAGDPGRQAFKDQVQTIGFLFLDDYLDNIVSGAKQDPLIELVKTPGRKKAVSKKPKLGPSKLGNIFTPDESENIAPDNSFHKALLNAAVELNELSVIAEDEEPSERTRSSTSGRDTEIRKSPFPILPEFPSVPEHIPVPSVDKPSNSMHQESVVISTLDADTFHSISLGSPDSSANQIDCTRPSNNFEPMIVDTVPSEHGLLKDCQEESNHKPEDDTTSVLSKPSEKVQPPLFPTLPEPMPLRKSTRFRDPSVSAVMLGVATPGAAAKRTSWLAKAREVKALEGTVKKSHMPAMTSTSNAMPVSAIHFLQGTKRKSGEMLTETQLGVQDEIVVQKAAKIEAGETAPRNLREKSLPVLDSKFEELSEQFTKNSTGEPFRDPDTSQEVVLHRLKKAVEELGVRGKTMGKSLGGDAANALAEAKAAAEARLAERDRIATEGSVAVGQGATPIGSNNDDDKDVPTHPSLPVNIHGGRLSVSDLFPKEGHIKEKHKVPEKVFHKLIHPPVFSAKEVETTRMSTSTTPPNTPPLQSTRNIQAEEPPYTKPAPVFVPPAPAPVALEPPETKKTFAFRSASPPKYNVPSAIALGFGPLFPSPKNKVSTMPLTAQSTVESVRSEIVFDNDDGPAWMPNTQDTEFTSIYGSQSQPHTQVCDEDDSWPVDEKLAAGVQWTYGVSKEDSMTWSTLPSQSQRADTGPITKTSPIREEVEKSTHVPEGLGIEANTKDLIVCDEELEEIVLGSKSTVNLVKQPGPARSESQMSLASSESSQSQVGFFGQASKFLSSALGTSKKKPEVKKVLQMAAVAAKKQQEEADKKALRLKEMEMRRQQAMQRKAEEEKAKALEEEKKMKEELERRKREREEHTDKRPFKPTASKREDDTKKRKIELVPVEKKVEPKKPAPSVLLGKSHLKSSVKQSTTSHATTNGNYVQPAASSSSMTIDSLKSAHAPPTSQQISKPPVFSKQVIDEDFTQPSQLVQSQMAARAKAQIEASKPTILSENIELPDINSEYSDSEDEDRKRTFDPPDWAQSPELRHALQQQSTINPDDIFGAIRPLKMEEIFKTRTSRFRPRTSSANWTGSDRLTVQEEKEYARRMGFK